MEGSRTSISEKRATVEQNGVKFWDLWVVIQHIWGTFGLLALNVILASFGLLAIFHNLGVMIRERRKHFEWL